jgi:RND family efflux transporter MFP subunit
MINHLLLGAGLAVVALGLSAPSLMSSRDGSPETPARPVAAAVPELPAIPSAPSADRGEDDGYLGVVVALQSVELAARFDGTLERLDVHVGDHVKGGMPVARLDSRSIARDLAIAEAALQVTEAEHDRLSIELSEAVSRRTRLHSVAELYPREQIAAAESQEHVASARLRGSVADRAGRRARIDQLREMLRDAEIVAPFDGTIAARHVDAGATVSRGTPVVRLISPASLVIRFAVPEGEAAGVAVGRQVRVRVESAAITAAATVERIVPEIDAALRMVVVEARVAASDGRGPAIPSGATARISLAGEGPPAREAVLDAPDFSRHRSSEP